MPVNREELGRFFRMTRFRREWYDRHSTINAAEIHAMAYTIILGNKVYSSWSLRGWLLMRPFGIPFDQKVIDWLVAEYKKDQAIDLSKDPMALQRLKEAAEKARSSSLVG